MPTLRWDRLLETCIRANGSEILLLPQMPPFVRVENRLRALAVDPLTSDDIATMLRELAPPEQPNDHGVYEFDRQYGPYRFRIAAFGSPPRLTILMRLPQSAATPPMPDP